jgi:hypothetical protein
MADEGFTGMAALIADLEALGPSCEREAGVIIDKHPEAMAQSVRAGYPVKDGALRNGVVVRKIRPLRNVVVSRAKHAHLFERGTVRRSRASDGANRGTMPAGNVFIPAAVRWRGQMNQQLIGMVRRSKVRGMTGTLDVVERGD